MKVEKASPNNAEEILLLQRTAYRSEAELYGDDRPHRTRCCNSGGCQKGRKRNRRPLRPFFHSLSCSARKPLFPRSRPKACPEAMLRLSCIRSSRR